MLVHPDKNMGSPLASESFKKLQCAYEVGLLMFMFLVTCKGLNLFLFCFLRFFLIL